MSENHDARLDGFPTRETTVVVVDCIEGLSQQTKLLIGRSMAAGLKPVLMLTNVDRCFLELKMDGEDAYQAFSEIIADFNRTSKVYNSKLLKDVSVHPSNGTVLFASSTWGFSIPQFASMCELRYGSNKEKIVNRLWGDNFFDPIIKKWTTSSTNSSTCKRGFVLFVYNSVCKVLNSSLSDQKDRLQLMMQKLGHKEIDMEDFKGATLFNHVMQKWLPTRNLPYEDFGDLLAASSNVENVDAVRKNSLEESKRHLKISGLAENKTAHFRFMPMGSVERPLYLPSEVLERLAPYQIDAVHWLWGLHCECKGGILADDMGMGKTRTVCSFLRGLLHCSLVKRAIIIAPKTILTQWGVELQNVGLADQIEMYRTPISQEESLSKVIKRGGVLLTTYEVFRSKHKTITCEDTKMIEWDYIFLDEGHRIKNENTQTSKAFSTLKCDHKIVITGTPFQNNLKELYVLVDFCCPNLLGNEQEFLKKFAEPIEKAKFADSKLGLKRRSMSASEALKQLLKPYMLRRTKKLLQAMGLLGKKHEMTVWLEMTPTQVQLYKSLLTEVKLGNSDGVAFAEAAVAKNICNHPSMLRTIDSASIRIPKRKEGLAKDYKQQLLELVSFRDSHGSSCKLVFIISLVKLLISQQHKILIFSQSVSMLELVEQALFTVMSKSKIIRMDGSTSQPERDEKRKQFQASIENPEKISPDDVPDVFLMTTSVGGMGLNLTAASRVIIVDPAQNPSMDNQSVDRAFRFGQKKDVFVYRLVTASTIEEHTYRQQVLKGEVSTSVTEIEQCARGLEKEKGRVLTLPIDGFDRSLTYEELLDSPSHTDFDKSILEHVDFVRKHRLVVGVINHSSLFSVEEFLPLPCEDDSPVDIGRHYRKKIPHDIVIGGEKYAFKLKDSDFSARFSVGSGDRKGKQKLQNEEEISGTGSCPEAGDVHEQRGALVKPGSRSGDDDPHKAPDTPG